jgi:hypothetical protein
MLVAPICWRNRLLEAELSFLMMGNGLRNQYTPKKADPQKNRGPALDDDSDL